MRKQYIFQSALLISANAAAPFVAIIMPRIIINELTSRSQFSAIILSVGVMAGINLIITNLQAYLQNYTLYSAKFMMIPLSVVLNRKNMDMDFENTEDPEILDEKEKAQSIAINGGCTDKYLIGVNDFITSIIRLVGLSYIVSTVSITVLLIIISASVFQTWYSIRIQRKNFDINTEIIPISRMKTYLQDLGRNAPFGKTIRVYQLGEWLMEKLSCNRQEYLSLRHKLIINNTKQTTTNLIIVTFQELMIYIFLIYKVIKDNMPIGDFVMYTNSVTQFPGVFGAISGSYIRVRENGRYITHYRRFVNRPNHILSAGEPSRPVSNQVRHTVEFRHVSFKYPRTDTYTLKDINLTIDPGEKLSIVGENGAGKTTFIKLLLRLYDVSEGAILLDGHDIREYDYREYLNNIATVFQDYRIFAFSVKENVALGMSDTATDESIWEVLHQGGIEGKIRSLPQGLSTHLSRQFSENGVSLSGGEQQKIALCRAIFKNAPIVVLDEPTSSLSPLAEYDVYKRFNEMVRDKTAIFVSHRLSSSQFCDKVALFDDGKILEYGSHHELLRQNGRYAAMFNLQASYYREEESECDA